MAKIYPDKGRKKVRVISAFVINDFIQSKIQLDRNSSQSMPRKKKR